MTKIVQGFQKLSKDPQLLAIVFFAFFSNGMMSTMIGSILPLMTAEYQLSYTVGGMAISAHQAGNLLACFVSGFLPYAIGRKKSTISLGAGILIGMVLMTLTGNPAVLLIAFAASGVGRGTMSNIANAVVSEITTDKTKSLNVLHATFAVGAFMAPFTAMFITGALHGSWRFAAWIVALFSLLSLVMFGRSSLSNTPSPKEAGGGAVGFLHSFRFWNVTAILFFYLCAEATIVGWLVSYFKDSNIMGTALAQSTSAILWIMILAGRLLCAYFSGRVQKSRLIIVMSVAMTVFYIAMISTRDIRVIFPCLMGLGISMAGIYPTTFSCMDPRYTSSTAAVGTCISLATMGGIAMPMLVGSIAQRSTIEAGMGAISVALAAMLVLAVVNHISYKRSGI